MPHSQLILLQASSNPNIYISLSLSLSPSLLAKNLNFLGTECRPDLYYWCAMEHEILVIGPVCLCCVYWCVCPNRPGQWLLSYTLGYNRPSSAGHTFLTCNDEIISAPPPPPAPPTTENTSKQQTNTRVPSPYHLSVSHWRSTRLLRAEKERDERDGDIKISQWGCHYNGSNINTTTTTTSTTLFPDWEPGKC